jgi:hypothetical protein
MPVMVIKMNLQSLAVSGLQKMYMREWDNAQEAIDNLPQIPILSDIKSLMESTHATMGELLKSDMELGVLSFNKEIEALAEFMTSVQMLVETTDFSKSVDAAIIVAASQQEDSPPLPVFAGYSLGPENEKPTLEVPYNLVDDKGQLKPKHEATARSMASLNKIPNELHGSLPSADESQILWERKNTNGE